MAGSMLGTMQGEDDLPDVNTLNTVLKFLGAKAKAYDDISYDPTFISSAIFPIICGGGTSVTFSFMNYWKHKNEIDQVSCLMTVRAQKGNTILRSYFRIERDTYSFKFPDLVGAHLNDDDRFVGSVEFQVHSIEDLKYPYPAIVIIYESPEGVSMVHTASRVFHSIADMDKRLMTGVQESGFDIYANEVLTPFICFTNGPRPVEQAKVAFSAFNSVGEQKTLDLDVGDLNAFETVFVFPDEHYELKEFLGDEVGFCKINYDSFGIFPRLICGNISRDYSRFAITHSYYDESTRREYFDFDPKGTTRSPFCGFPLLFGEQIELDLNFYPIYAPGELQIRAQVFDSDGTLLADEIDLGSVVSPSNTMVSVPVREVLKEVEIPLEDIALLSVECSTQSGQIPARINYGVNYHRPGRIGTNINRSMHQDLAYEAEERSRRWLPVFTRGDLTNKVLISTLSNRINDDFVADVKLTILNELGQIYAEEFSVANQTSRTLQIEDVLTGVGHKASDGDVLWCTVESECPYIDVYYLILSNQGNVGGDHSF